jgi:hypothetical protein
MSLVFSIKTQHEKLFSVWSCTDIFSSEEIEKIINIVKTNKVNNAQVGLKEGNVEVRTRKSKIFWIPKEEQ